MKPKQCSKVLCGNGSQTARVRGSPGKHRRESVGTGLLCFIFFFYPNTQWEGSKAPTPTLTPVFPFRTLHLGQCEGDTSPGEGPFTLANQSFLEDSNRCMSPESRPNHFDNQGGLSQMHKAIHSQVFWCVSIPCQQF